MPTTSRNLLWLGRSGVEYARWILAQEAAIAGQPYDALNQKWAGGAGSLTESNSVLAGISLDNYAIGNGTVSLKITDLERKVNINTAGSATLQQALILMGVDADDLSVVSDSILDWIDPDDSPHVAGAESDYYQGLIPPYYAKDAPIDDLSELLLVKNVTREIYWGGSATNHAPGTLQLKQKLGLGTAPGEIPSYPFGLEALFTPISSGQVNINTADANVLRCFSAEMPIWRPPSCNNAPGPDGVDGTEDDTPFPAPGQFSQFSNLLTTRSRTFEVRVTAQIGDYKREYTAILFRNSARTSRS